MRADDAEYKARKLMRIFGLEKMYDVRIDAYSKAMRQKVMLVAVFCTIRKCCFWMNH